MMKDENSLAAKFPKLAAEWHPTKNGELSPLDVTFGVRKKVWWQCGKCGHEWQATVGSRSSGRSCPACASVNRSKNRNKTVVLKNGSLQDKLPEMAAEWHPTKNGALSPGLVTPGSPKKVWWVCHKGHEWQAVIDSRVRGRYGCPYCSGRYAIPGETDLATTNPELAAEWHPTKNGELAPQMVTCGSNKKVWWQCPKGHEWQAIIANRSKGVGCPVCGNKKILVGENDLATAKPELAAEWHPAKNGELTPQMVAPGSQKKVWWQCPKGHEWQAVISNRSGKGTGCPICTAEQQSSFPEQAILYYFRKVTIAESRNTEFGKEIDVWLPELQIGIEHNGRYFHRGKKSADKEKVAYFEKLGIRIISVNEGEKNRVYGDNIEYAYHSSNRDSLNWAILTLFLTLMLPVPEIDVSAHAAAIYDQYIQTEKESSLATQIPELAAEWHPTKNGALNPEMVTSRSSKKVWWMCQKGHEWQAVVASRAARNGCPYCSGYKAWAGENDLATMKPELAAEWHPAKNGELTPQMVTCGSEKKVWWLGPCGHEWKAKISNRFHLKQGCPYCSGRYAIPGETDLATTNPELAAEWHPTKNGELTPQMMKPGSEKRVWWQCGKCGHEWQAVIGSRNAGYGCPVCGRKKQWESRRISV